MIKNKAGKWLGRLFLLTVLVFLYFPIVWMIIFSFTKSVTYSSWQGFSIDAYITLFNGPKSEVIFSALTNTIIVGVVVSAISTILGTLGAISIYAIRNKKIKATFNSASNIPLINADIVTAISLMLLFAILKSIFALTNKITNYISLILSHISFCAPYVVLNVMPRLSRLDKHIYEAAIDLGAKPLQAIWKVIMPQLMPGVITGAVLSFALSIDDFVITQYNIQGFHTISTYIYSTFSGKDSLPLEIRALTTIIFLCLLIMLTVITLKDNNSKNKTQNGFKKGEKK